MIRLTRLNRAPLVLNSDLIEHIDVTPDTVITLTTGQILRVREPAEDLLGRFEEALLHPEGSGHRRHEAQVHVEPTADVAVQAVPGARPARRLQQPDLVVVVQRPHRHAELVGHLPHRPHGVHQHSSGHALKGPASRRVRVKSSMRVPSGDER